MSTDKDHEIGINTGPDTGPGTTTGSMSAGRPSDDVPVSPTTDSIPEKSNDTNSENPPPATTTTTITTALDPTAAAVAADQLRASLVRKYDMRLMPACFLTFLFFFLDKSNIALARINGLEEDLGLTDAQFNIALMLFFVLNLAFNIPGNLALRRVGGGLWLPLLIVSWGLVTTFTGFVTNFAGLCVTRVFLGLTESSFFGGVLIYLGFFYTQEELVSRVGIFYSSTPLAGSIGGLLAGGLGQIRVNGYNGWPWIFFIEGLLTVLLGIGAYLLLPNTPREAKFLSPEERVLALQRMHDQDRKHYIPTVSTSASASASAGPDELESGSSKAAAAAAAAADEERDEKTGTSTPTNTGNEDRLELKTVKRAIFNFMTIVMSIGAFFAIEAIYSYALFLPTIVFTMGFRALQASLMTVPPNFVGFLFTLLACFWSQRSGKTALPLNVCAMIGMLGYVFLLVGGHVGGPPTLIHTGVQYAGTFFVAMSVNALPPLALTWMTINASPHYIRAIALGFVMTIGNLAAFLASFTYIKNEAPAYIKGHSINLGCLTGLLVIGIITPLWMRFENRKRERGERDYRLNESRYRGVMTREQYELQLGWLHPSYRYRM